MSEITAGSVVRLKSGGPKMTVEEVKPWSGKVLAYCNWFEGSESKSNSFPLTSLEIVSKESDSAIYVPRGTPGPDSWME